MNDLMQILYDYILDSTHEIYCRQTKRAMYQVRRDSISCKLQEQLTEEQRELFEEYQTYNNQMQLEELYAMFLAAFDQSAALLCRHTA